MLIAPAKVAATEAINISLFSMCAISCARTPSISSLLRVSSSEEETATTEFSKFLPVAKAFGSSES